MKKLSILAFAMGLMAFTACSEKKAPAPAPAQAEQTVVTDSAFQAAAAGEYKSADVGVGSQDDILQIKVQQLAADEAEQHIHQHHDTREHQQQRRLLDDLDDGGGHADDEQELKVIAQPHQKLGHQGVQQEIIRRADGRPYCRKQRADDAV